MDFKEIQTKEVPELQKLLAEYRETQRELRFKDSNKQLKNIRELRNIKKTIAQILTTLNKAKK
jgi:ribosomal protein L29